MKIMIRLFLIFFITVCLDIFVGKSAYSQDEKIANESRNASGDDKIAAAYRVFLRNGNYKEKKDHMKAFLENYNSDRVIDLTVNLLMYYYDDPGFRENDQVMYYDDVIAEDLIKILGKSGSKKGFPALLRVVLYDKHHRDTTVKEAWNAINVIHW